MTDSGRSNRETILATALDLFADRGYNGVGVEELASSSGVTKPTLYHYFGSKHGLLETLLREQYDPFLRELEAAAEYHHDLPNRITKVVTLFFDFGTREAKLYRMVIAAGLTARNDVATKLMAERIETQDQILRDLFERASHDHGNMKGRHHLHAAGLQATILAYLQLAATGEMTLDDAAIWRLRQQFSHGIYS